MHDRLNLTLDPRLLRRLRRTLLAGATAAVTIVGAAVVAAPPVASLSALPDPTRPPAAAAVPGPVASGRVTGAPAQTTAAEPARAAAPLRLLSVQLRGGGNSSALIDDRMVRVGDKVGERTVVAIDAEGVLLRGSGSGGASAGAAGERRLRLLGGDEKQPPGTIQITRSTRWQADPLPADPALAGASAPGRPAPVSLAERTHP